MFKAEHMSREVQLIPINRKRKPPKMSEEEKQMLDLLGQIISDSIISKFKSYEKSSWICESQH